MRTILQTSDQGKIFALPTVVGRQYQHL